MEKIIDHLSVIGPLTALPWIIFIIAVIRNKQRFRNSFLLMIAMGATLLLFAAMSEDMISVLLYEAIVIYIIILLVPFLLIFNGIVMLRNEGRSLANLLSLLMGVAIGIGESAFLYFHIVLAQGEAVGTGTRLIGLLGYTALYLSIIFLAFMFYTVFIAMIPLSFKYEYIIIHGCGLLEGSRVSRLLSNRIDTALRTYKACNRKRAKRNLIGHTILIPSGGRGSDEQLSEAKAMQLYLRERGVPDEDIIIEDQSPNTLANLENSAAIIKARGGGKTALVTSNYHVYRCLVLAKEIGLECTGIGAPVALYFWPSALIREFAAVFSEKKKFVPLAVVWLFCAAIFMLI